MYPELFKIPFINLTVKSYGLMLVIGFIFAFYLIKRLSRTIAADSQFIANAALYALIAGVIGARLFYVIHYFERFRGNLFSVFAIWEGGLELLGGVLFAILVVCFHLKYHKLPVRRYLDILAIGLMLALAFGRIGCFLRGCCFGKPTNLPWAIRFPYGSDAYCSQVYPDLSRNRPQPRLKLPDEFLNYYSNNGAVYYDLKPYDQLTPQQKEMVTTGPYRCPPIHPTQLYSSANALILCFILYAFWRRAQKAGNSKNRKKLFSKPGCTFGLAFIIYGITRFFMEFVRDDNPIGFDGLTISQNIGIAMFVVGVLLMVIFEKMKTQQLK